MVKIELKFTIKGHYEWQFLPVHSSAPIPLSRSFVISKPTVIYLNKSMVMIEMKFTAKQMNDDSCMLILQLLLRSAVSKVPLWLSNSYSRKILYLHLWNVLLPYVYPVPNLEGGLFIGESSKFRRALDGPPVVENSLADFIVEVCSGILVLRRLLWSGILVLVSFWVAGLIADKSNKWSSFLFEGLVAGQKSGVTGAIADEAPELYQLLWFCGAHSPHQNFTLDLFKLNRTNFRY